MWATISFVTSLGAFAPGISTVPITMSAASTCSRIDNADETICFTRFS